MINYSTSILTNLAKSLRKHMNGTAFAHFKGNIYSIDNITIDSETNDLRVIYRDHGQNGDNYWDRPFRMFTSAIDKDKYPDVNAKLRFTPVNNSELEYSMSRIPFIIRNGILERGPAILDHNEWLVDSGIMSGTELDQSIDDGTVQLGYIDDDAVWFFGKYHETNPHVEDMANRYGNQFDVARPVCCGYNKMTTDDNKIRYVPDKICKEAIKPRLYTFEFEYELTDGTCRTVSFLASTDTAAVRLYNRWAACDAAESAINYKSISVITDGADEHRCDNNISYGTSADFDEFRCKRGVTAERWKA